MKNARCLSGRLASGGLAGTKAQSHKVSMQKVQAASVTVRVFVSLCEIVTPAVPSQCPCCSVLMPSVSSRRIKWWSRVLGSFNRAKDTSPISAHCLFRENTWRSQFPERNWCIRTQPIILPMPQQRSKGNRRVAARLSDRHGIVFGKSAAVTYSTKVMSVTSTETTTAASIFDFAAARHRVGEACRSKQFFKLLKVARLSEPRIWQTSAGTAELLCCLT